MSETTSAGSALPSLTRLGSLAAGAAVLGAIGMAAGFAMDSTPGKRLFWAAFHYGYIFWLGLTLGCTTLTFLHHTIRAQWSLSILKVLEAGNKLIPVMFVFFAVEAGAALLGKQIYPWADPSFYNGMHPNKQAWLNPIAWLIRGVIYFAFWAWTTSKLNASSKRQDETLDENLAEARKSFAAPMGVIHVILLTGAMLDWMMSLNPNWMSTLYGAWHMATGILATIAFGTFLTLSLRDKKPYVEAVNPMLTKDLGNMMLGFTMVFGYFTLSQFLIIWSGNLPEEITFFVNRFHGWLVYVGAAIVVCQFFGPFLALLAGKTKREPQLLVKVAAWIFFFRMLDMWWQVTPFFKHGLEPELILWLFIDIAGLLFVGGVWLSVFTRNLKTGDLLPAHDRRIQETKAALEAH